jgi:hypothetical protein
MSEDAHKPVLIIVAGSARQRKRISKFLEAIEHEVHLRTEQEALRFSA